MSDNDDFKEVLRQLWGIDLAHKHLFDDWKFVREELLILRAVDLIMSRLLERDISADKVNKPADLAILFLNDSE